jgi:multiple sugar transport system substrate-binding protein
MKEVKKIAILALVVVMVISMIAMFSLTGCKTTTTTETTAAETTAAETTAAATTAAETTAAEVSGTVEFWSYIPLDNLGFYKYIDKFNSSQDKIKINTKFIPFDELKRQLTVALAGGNPPDFILVDNPDFASFIAMGAFQALDDRIANWEYGKDDFYPGPWASATWEGKQYGIPYETNTLALFLNIDMFKAAGLDPDKPPTTWEELTEYAKKLTKNGVFGLSACAKASEEGTFQWLPFLQQNGGDVFNLNSPAAVEALQLWVDWVNNGYVSKEIINMDQWAGVRPQWQNGQAAMMINGPWCVEAIKSEVPDLNWKVALLPGRVKQASAMGGVDFGIMTGAKNPDAAWEYIKWLYKPENNVAEYWKAFGSLPLMPKIAESAPYWKDDPVYKVFTEQMKYASPRGPHPKWPEISAAIYTAMQEALTGVKTSEQALADAAVKVEEITKE